MSGRHERAAAAWDVGDFIADRWYVHGVIETGGMANVYIVYDRLRRESFAAKTWRDEIFRTDPAFADRFRHEARIWIELDRHPNVVEARYVEHFGDKPFLLLEYVTGGSLADRIGPSGRRIDPAQAVRFALHVCDGMLHAASRGLSAHLDLKPANCLIAEDGTLKVSDFGLARLRTDKHVSIGTAPAGGTPEYMAPEQFDANHSAGERADVYALGVMLHEMLTGRRPFRARTRAELAELHRTAQPPALTIDHEPLAELVRACLAKEPTARPGFGSLRARLAECFQSLTGRTAPVPATGIELDARRSNDKGLTLARIGYLDDAMVQYDRALELDPGLGPAWLNRGTVLLERGLPAQALEHFERAIELDPGDAQAHYNAGCTLRGMKRAAEALGFYRRAVDLDPYFEQALVNWGRALEDLGRPEEAIACYDRALDNNPQLAQAWYNRGVALGMLRRDDEALDSYQHAVDIEPRTKAALSNMGLIFVRLGRIADALRSYDRALEIDAAYIPALFNKASLLHALGAHHGMEHEVQLGDALALCERILAIEPNNDKALLLRERIRSSRRRSGGRA